MSKPDLVYNDAALEAPPPPYELHSTGDVLSVSAAVTATGSIDVAFTSTAQADLRQLIDSQQNRGQQNEPHPSAQSNDLGSIPSGNVPSLNIVIQVVGSRGDVQPFIALGVALKRRGHRVRLATHDTFDKFVRESGIEFYPIGGDPADLMAYMVKNPGLMPSLESLRGGDIGRKRSMVKEMLHGCWLSCVDADPASGAPFVADAIIANPPSFAHVHCAQALSIPVHIIFTMPWCATRAFPHPLANIKQKGIEPANANWLTYGVVDLMTWQGLGDVINGWRKQDLELEPLNASMGPGINSYLRIPHTYCWSPSLVSKPADWGPEIDVCGFFMRDPPAYQPPPDLEAFLSAGPPPVYVGFGSIVLEDPARLTDVILEATRRCGVRVIISRGWSKLGGDSPSNQHVFYLGDCPHEWLFTKVSAVVHHGGAGTTACGLSNGRPTIIVPFFGDQPFWANVVAAAGAGPRPIPQMEMTVERLTEALQFALSPDATRAAAILAQKMGQEDGVATAVESFHRWLPLEKMRCEIDPSRVARWEVEVKGKRRLRLSDTVVTTLLAEKQIKKDDLHALKSKEYNTDVQRWDPLSGGASSTLGMVTDFTTALGGTFIDPFRAYKLKRKDGSSGSAGGAAMMSAAGGVGSMVGVVTKGTLVDTPLALAEGLRNIPKLYGEEVKNHGQVKGVGSGSVVAAKNFGHGFYDGLTGFVTQPYKGAKEEGALGFLKGAGKGTAGLIVKPGSAMLGLMAYPAQGVYKSIRAARGRKAAVKKSKSDLLDWKAPVSDVQIDTRQVCIDFGALSRASK
ncbi:glycosyltransferase family 28 domain-containing protein [Pyricularia oryzae 70-15]|uniref:Glycosyltransferase family 28 domain-containing protein n=2 Tax=Pyricularia oryzae (strain 70-15 / ATCC MYA-4617 / FGSC 8958) TaxID=242507 RepID=G4MW32_PYRO7|nr:glycosyltransferase family 28 domain-containing protein [Pyricularia oryzae 70-15]EHA54186.1 glycosyltransferase family 28 domain-containing protein [Pyricularia oryzae 70-15]KAI7911670.1 glycosyltransferase family 28 domain-containing protein [Pyricularia oryzae]